ncbi:MAG: DNA helicase-2/ATP-dependent DNA helicase PcrA [Polyangiales bacterium]|jgi:DNA helicase-2/ATP-dependent DNA helicase PcrA
METKGSIQAKTDELDGATDPEMDGSVAQEEKVLARVARTVAARTRTPRNRGMDYDKELLELRDQIRNARMEDVPPLIEEMERLAGVAARRAKVTEGVVDPMSPYFGRLVLEEGERKREVLIGRSTYLDPKTGVRIVDWRDAPVSRIYYRYEEGDDYDETFGGREVEGAVIVRRSLGISLGRLTRIASPQGTFARRLDGTWKRAGASATRLAGGQGIAMRPEKHQAPTGKLGVNSEDHVEDKSLGEITALIDARQFDLISQPTSGLVVIQGGAGSGKTTIGLHRLAYLVFQDKKRFRNDNMLVVVFNDALVRYISRVLPSLGVPSVPVMTYERWASKLRRSHFPNLPKDYADNTPSAATKLKKHPRLLGLIDAATDVIVKNIDGTIVETAKRLEGGGRALSKWRESPKDAPEHRLETLRAWLKKPSNAEVLSLNVRHTLEREIDKCVGRCQDVVGLWGELLTDRSRLQLAFEGDDSMGERELEWAHSWCARQIPLAIAAREGRMEAFLDGEAKQEDAIRGADGANEEDQVTMDVEDDAILLRLYQRLRGPLMRGKQPIVYEHIFVDETQDVSPVELAVVVNTASERQSITLAGDVAQKLYMDNGFTNWQHVLQQLKLDHVSVEPLKLSYRSTHEILDFATEVLGPRKNEVTGQATRHGAPVEFFGFAGTGEAVAFLSEALRELARAEPLASIAIISRTPEEADIYHKGLVRAEVPNARRIANQDYPFRPGIDITDVRQVKGLEFDYVILVDVNASTYIVDDESRHLLHIAATRAAHQLWIISTATPSRLIPTALIEA